MTRLAAAKPSRAQLFFAAIVALVTAITVYLLFTEKNVPPLPTTNPTPVVEVVTVQRQNLHLPLKVRGIVEPEKQLNLIATVTGTVIHVSDKLSPGIRFNKGDILLKVDTTLLEAEMHRARSALAQAILHEQLIKAEIEAAAPVDEKEKLSELAQGKPQLAAATSTRESAQAAVHLAEKQLANATLRAPFNGRVMARSVNEQEPVAAGRPLAQIYATDSFLIRLPLTQEQLAMIDIPSEQKHTGSRMLLTNENTGQQWQATAMRSDSFIGPNRLINVIARLENGRDTLDSIIPGSLLLAEIQGRLMENVIRLPAGSIIDNRQIMAVRPDNRIQRKNVAVLWQDGEQAWVTGDLAEGDRVVVTPTEALPDNMLVTAHNNGTIPLP